MSTVKFVNYRKPIASAIGEIIASKGLETYPLLKSLADVGYVNNNNPNAITIYYPTQESSLMEIFRFFCYIKKARVELGIIYFDKNPNITDPKRWRFDVFGRENLNIANQIIAEIVAVYNDVDFDLNLISEVNKLEGIYYPC